MVYISHFKCKVNTYIYILKYVIYSDLVDHCEEPISLKVKARLLYGVSKIVRQKSFFLYGQ